ncbi:MAG: penicillin-binding transpeptidase domain-containing protein [Clostridiales bacterium]
MVSKKGLMPIFLKSRILWIFILFLFLFSAIFCRLFYLQVVKADELKDKAAGQQMREVPVEANRGVIFDCNRKILAASVSVDSVYASPTQIEEEKVPEIAAALSTILGIEEDKITQRLTSGRGYEWLKRKIGEEEALAIRNLDYKGIGLTTETKRNYPNDFLAAHLLGFVGIDNQGLEGIEAIYDKTLIGKNGYILAQYDSHGMEIAGSAQHYVAPKDGNSLILSVDENIQYFCERELDNLMASTVNPKGATIVMMAPKTGEILALATRPSYDPNNFGSYDVSAWRNWALSDYYEPGSTAKILTIATALEEGAVKETDTFYDSGSITVGKTKIRCWSGTPHGSETFVEVAENSCNPAFVEVGQRIDAKDDTTFYRYLKAFGIGEKTGIALPGESGGSLRNLATVDSINPLDVANMYIGQGYGVTPIQLVTAVSAGVNGGTLMEPHLVKTIEDCYGKVVENIDPVEIRQVISEKTSERVRNILESVVANGTGSKAYIEGYRVGGKTGTAQKFIDGAYSKTKYVASFIGFAPANNPELVCLVVVDEPGCYPVYGGTIAAPVFQKVVADTLSYMGVKPQVSDPLKKIDENAQTELKKEIVITPSVIGLNKEDAQKVIADKKLVAEFFGDGEMVATQTPGALAQVEAGSKIILNLGAKTASSVTIPDLTGKRMLECGEILGALGLSLIPAGAGTAQAQDPVAGTAVKRGTAVNIVFSNESKEDIETLAP